MFSFFRKYAATIHDIDLYPNVALFLFVFVFLAMFFFALKADKKYIDEIQKLPLD